MEIGRRKNPRQNQTASRHAHKRQFSISLLFSTDFGNPRQTRQFWDTDRSKENVDRLHRRKRNRSIFRCDLIFFDFLKISFHDVSLRRQNLPDFVPDKICLGLSVFVCPDNFVWDFLGPKIPDKTRSGTVWFCLRTRGGLL